VRRQQKTVDEQTETVRAARDRRAAAQDGPVDPRH
jgi:hypothetical protein